ncbi:carbohydrate kinase [Tessaracoccus sp. HDW20]|uniref:PfkB family carbohydrate kinase n=1 Tax=Tessaracoccus coleopterorum TaxID=2714950 RepID=UPI0018D2A7C0|nr:PfkB family carbohydrate kinase [Tessaracoccus coleopterorum]NHB84408.1 carbohydrate kinase [Tessaracoccus coleopterorum]
MRFVVCGEALIDLIPDHAPAATAGKWTAYSGGGPFNTARALATLGEDVDFLGRLSTDAFGQQLRMHLAGAGVGLGLSTSTEEATSLAIVSLDDVGKADYCFHFDKTSNFGWQAGDFPTLQAGDWLHFGSIGTVVGAGAPALLDFVNQTAASLSYDINVRPSTMPDRSRYLERVSSLMRAVGRNAGIVKASDEDIAWLVEDGSDPLYYAQRWASDFGLSMFVVTLGAEGAMAVTPDGRQVASPGREVAVVDTVGAGDTFMAGFLSSLSRTSTMSKERLIAVSLLRPSSVAARGTAPSFDEVARMLGYADSGRRPEASSVSPAASWR